MTLILNKGVEQEERILWAILALVGRPDGFLDVGAKEGWLVKSAFHMGIRPSMGIDSNPELCAGSPSGCKILCRNMDRPLLNFDGYFELITCLELFNNSKNPEILATNLVRLTSKWLVVGTGWPVSLTENKSVKLDEDLTERMEHALQRSLGVFKRV